MSRKSLAKHIIIYLGDLLSVFAAFFLSVLFTRIYQDIFTDTSRVIIYLAEIFIIYNIVFFSVRYFRDSVFNFDSFSAVTVGISLAAIYVLFFIINMIAYKGISLPALLLALVFSCFFGGTYRIAIIAGSKILIGYMKGDGKSGDSNVIIYGAGEAGKFLANMLSYDKSKKMNVVAFIDDNKEFHGRRIKGYPVVGDRYAIADAVAKFKADQIIIAVPHVDNSNFREIVELSCQSGCKVRRFANMSDLNMTDLSKATINDINIEDLLCRDPVQLDLRGVREMLRDKVLLVSGGAGSIGSEICRQVLSYEPRKVIILDINENGLFMLGNELRKEHDGRYETVVGSIKDKLRLDEIMEQYKPDIVFHAAAYKHVPMMELNPIEAVANNVYGTYNIMLSAIEHGVENFTMISTDKAVNPTNIMGVTKRITELLCKSMSLKSSGTKFCAVRFGNVLGSNGSVISVFKEQIRQGGPITVTDKEIKRYFMTIPEAVQLVLEASSISKGGELFVLDMGSMVKIYDLALTMIRLSGLEPEKDIKIEISGLRPGEKMYEELKMDTESLASTTNDRIFIFDYEDFNQREFEYRFKKLSLAFQRRDIKSLCDAIMELVPTYMVSEYITKKYLEPVESAAKIPTAQRAKELKDAGTVLAPGPV